MGGAAGRVGRAFPFPGVRPMAIATSPRGMILTSALLLLVGVPGSGRAQPPVRASGSRGGLLPRRASDDSVAAPDSAKGPLAAPAAKAAPVAATPDNRQREEALPEMETDRPDFTEAASLVPAGHLQFEGGQTFTREGGSH